LAESDEELRKRAEDLAAILRGDYKPPPPVFNWLSVLEQTCNVINEAADIDAGVAALIAYGSSLSKANLGQWDFVRPIAWSQDAFQCMVDLRQRIATMPPATTGVYIGLDGLNMERGGIEIGYNKTRAIGTTDIQWIYACDSYGPNFSTAALIKYYHWNYNDRPDDLSHEECLLLEYTAVLGFAGLVVRDALEKLAPALVCHGVTERAFAIGFHDGDMLGLGVATPSGFKRRAKLGELLPG
jgi:hypothetical protein